MTFEEFDSIEEMFETQARAELQAQSQILPWQRNLLVAGAYAVRVAHGLMIFHEILAYPVDEVQASEVERLTENYVFSRGYSVACPEGELGDAHKATFLAVITKDMFEASREANWYIANQYNIG